MLTLYYSSHIFDYLTSYFLSVLVGLAVSSAVQGPAEEISVEDVRKAIINIKNNKAPGPSGIAPEMLKAAGEAGVQWVTDMCNATNMSPSA